VISRLGQRWKINPNICEVRGSDPVYGVLPRIDAG
jgi:hypothetical protein